MQSTPTKTPKRGLFKRCSAFVLVLVLLLQTLAFSTSAVAQEIELNTDVKNPTFSASGIGNLTQGELTEQLRNEIIASMNENLVKRVEDNELSGPVGVIITFSDDSIISTYSSSKYANSMTYEEFRATKVAKDLDETFRKNQNKVIDRLLDAALVDEVRYTYTHLMDAAFVTTTYENISAISKIEGVERVMISNTYLPQAAVSNPVDVYDTGIFNSGSVSYTGKGTLVAVLDTGCDYTHSAFTTYAVKGAIYDRAFVEKYLESTEAYKFSLAENHLLEAREVYYGNLTLGKIVYGYDYADKDPDIMPLDNSHGTHVAGIIGGKDDKITGVAIDTQFAIMKVFSDYKAGAEDGDVLAALEDSIILGVDAINMSLGSSCGYTYESAAEKQYKNDVYSRVEQAGISLIVAASNDYSSAMGGENGNTNKTENPDSATVGSPSTYNASMSVASINGQKENYMLANGTTPIFFHQSNNNAAKPYDFFEMLGITQGKTVTYDYVAVPGVGMAVNYAGIDVQGKIALVKRGDITFEEKVQFAQEAGAVAVIIYNNVSGTIYMTIGNHAKIPAVSISKDDGDILAAQGSGTLEFTLANEAGPFMSDFSSWGPNPDLSLKPDITAHGGNILSAIVGNDYEEMSGTSMACPNMCGITVLIRQYVNENFPQLSNIEQRDLVNQLCMSTATIALDKNGNPYSPRKQGAGIADIRKATTTLAYLFRDDHNRTKFELGDDPERTGVYEMKVGIKNVSDKSLSYTLGAIVMTESVSTSDPEYVAEIAYLLSNTTEYIGTNCTIKDGVVTVGAGETAYVTVTIKLSDADKAYLNSTFENGMYVEGYITFDNTDENGVDLNAPFLAFYGDWGEAPIFDLDYYEVETEAHNDAIDDDDKIKADYYATTPLGLYYYDYVVPLGGYLYKMDESLYSAIPATRDKAAISYYADAISGLFAVYAGLLRGAKEMSIKVTNTSTGEVVWQEVQYNCYKSHYRGGPAPYAAKIDLPGVDTELGKVLGDNNSKFEVTMEAKLDWDGGENKSDFYSFSFYIDYQAPTVTSYSFRTKYDNTRKENRYYLDLMVYDNHYAMSCRPVVVYDSQELADDGVTYKKAYASLSEYPIPVYQETIGTATKVSFEITDYLEKIAGSSMPNGIAIYLDDYALNSSLSYIPFPGTEGAEDVEFNVDNDELHLDIHETADLAKLLVSTDTAITLESDYLRTLKWEITEGKDVLAMHNGYVEALKSGTAIVQVTSDSWGTKDVPIYKKLIVHVSENVMENNPDSGMLVKIEDLSFSHLVTLFAHNTDIDYSEIGKTGNIHYFGGNYSTSCYPGESFQLFYELKPWNLDPSRYTLKFQSSNPNVASVDENGVVEAHTKGKARISLSITVDGKNTAFRASLSVEVKSEFIIENRTLVAYKGKGGDVVIPDDEGILYIGKYAFAHYDLDNTKDVPKDEYGNYEFDDKKTPLGNNTVTSVTIPEGVETIQKYAFYNCTALTDVTLPESCITIETCAFQKCSNLKNVNFDNVKIVGAYAFNNCVSLDCEGLGGANTSKLYSAANYAFANTGFTSLKLPALSRIGEYAFASCESLTTVELGQRTRISKGMFKNTAINTIVVYSDTVSDEAFMSCDRLTKIEFVNDLTYLGASAFAECTELSTVIFKGECEKIGEQAFNGCTDLISLTLPEGKVEIGNEAFIGSAISELIFVATTEIEAVGVSAFSNLATTKKLTINVDDSDVYTVSNGAIYTTDEKTLVMVIPSTTVTTFTVPAKVEKIGDGAFSSLPLLFTVRFEGGSALTEIGNSAFCDCLYLTTVALPEQPIKVGDYAFAGTESLKSLDMANITEVGDFAFWNSAIKSANLTSENVKLGYASFYATTALETVTLGKNATIGEQCFRASNVVRVDLLGDAEILEGAFYGCFYLKSFDFADVTGKIGDYAFWACVELAAVNAPKITEVGENAFADCYSLAFFSADSLVTIGEGAFATLAESTYANLITSLNLPSVEVIHDAAFYQCVYLESANLPSLKQMGSITVDKKGVESLGGLVFYNCSALKSITFSDELFAIGKYNFYGCTSLTDFDISHVKSFGEAAFYGVALPETLVMTNAETVGDYAFMFDAAIVGKAESALVKVSAPNLKNVGYLAFSQNVKLAEFTAPNMVKIDTSAFSYTAITEFEVGPNLEKFGLGAFQNCDNLTAFYFTDEDGNKVYTGELGNVKLVDGVLYLIHKNGYTLLSYPAAKTGEELVVIEGTTRIETSAAQGNKNLLRVVLPSTLKVIGDYSFYLCDNLKSITFKSYHAPVLEGSMLGNAIKIDATNRDEYTGFQTLYGFDYYYRLLDKVTLPLYYRNFIDNIGKSNTDGLVAILPTNCEGYDTILYTTYFTISEETSGVTTGKYAVAFIDAVKALPEVADRFDSLAVENAILTYNALLAHKDELVYLTDELLERYNKAVDEYYVDIAEDKIAHLFDMAMNEYSFNVVKEARATYNSLTDAQRQKVANADRLNAKIEELSEVFGTEINFELNYEDNLPEPIEPPTGGDDPAEPNDGLDAWVIVLICVGAALVLAGAAAAVVVVLKKRKTEE